MPSSRIAWGLIATVLMLGFAGCETQRFGPRLTYGLTDESLEKIAKEIGFQVDAMGLGDYAFTRGATEFHAHIHNAPTDRTHRVWMADAPVHLSYDKGNVMKPIHQRSFDVSRGMPMEDITREFRLFVAEINSKSAHRRTGC